MKSRFVRVFGMKFIDFHDFHVKKHEWSAISWVKTQVAEHVAPPPNTFNPPFDFGVLRCKKITLVGFFNLHISRKLFPKNMKDWNPKVFFCSAILVQSRIAGEPLHIFSAAFATFEP